MITQLDKKSLNRMFTRCEGFLLENFSHLSSCLFRWGYEASGVVSGDVEVANNGTNQTVSVLFSLCPKKT